MLDVIIAGAGPAGSVAALVLARAGARVLLLDRETFPRDKLCGDTVNPGAVARLRALGLEGGPLATARSLAGMRVSGPTTTVTAPYGDGQRALALTRRALDTWLLEAAIAAGARFESGLVVPLSKHRKMPELQSRKRDDWRAELHQDERFGMGEARHAPAGGRTHERTGACRYRHVREMEGMDHGATPTLRRILRA